MKLWIQTPSTMAIDNCLISGLTFPGLAANVYMVFWDGVTNKGEIEYSNAMPIRTPFADPSPYLVYVNAWIVKGQTETPPINLPQAKLIKQDVVETLFHYKRQLPLSLYGYSWDATDDSAAGLNRIVSAQTPDVTDQSVTQITNLFNQAIYDHIIDLNNKLDAATVSVDVTTSGTAPAEGGAVSGTGTGTGTINVANMTWGSVNPPTNAGDGFNLTWTPIGYTSPVTLTYSQLVGLITGIENRRATLNSVRLTKRNAINALTTITAVAAYNVTTGW